MRKLVTVPRNRMTSLESRLLVFLATLEEPGLSSGAIARQFFQTASETGSQRAQLLNIYRRLEGRGYIQRDNQGRWVHGFVTKLGQSQAVFEATFPKK